MKQFILTLIFTVGAILLNAQGFTTFIKPTETQKTFDQHLNSLTGKQKLAYLSDYAQGTNPVFVHDSIANVPEWFIKQLWIYWNELRDDTYIVMRGEYMTKEAVYDDKGNLVTPAQYLKVPNDEDALVTLLQKKYSNVFSVVETKGFIKELIKRSEVNARGKYVGKWNRFKNALSNE